MLQQDTRMVAVTKLQDAEVTAWWHNLYLGTTVVLFATTVLFAVLFGGYYWAWRSVTTRPSSCPPTTCPSYNDDSNPYGLISFYHNTVPICNSFQLIKNTGDGYGDCVRVGASGYEGYKELHISRGWYWVENNSTELSGYTNFAPCYIDTCCTKASYACNPMWRGSTQMQRDVWRHAKFGTHWYFDFSTTPASVASMTAMVIGDPTKSDFLKDAYTDSPLKDARMQGVCVSDLGQMTAASLRDTKGVIIGAAYLACPEWFDCSIDNVPGRWKLDSFLMLPGVNGVPDYRDTDCNP